MEVGSSRPILFVAREPDETLRTFLPILAELGRRERDCRVLFHHEPGAWAVEQLGKLGISPIKTDLPGRDNLLTRILPRRIAAPLGELSQLRSARRLAQRLIDRLDPAAVVVIQDTLLLERFLVREANRRGRGTLVVQWAFTFPQATYDLLKRYQQGDAALPSAPSPGASGGPPPQTDTGRTSSRNPHSSAPRGPARRFEPAPDSRPQTPNSVYALVQRFLGVDFDLVNSYGGGEARVFAVMGEAFRDQFLSQGVRKERIEVTGHPLHDAAFAQRAALTPEHARALKERYGLPPDARLVLYATQPVLWRKVVTPAELVENVRAIARAVAALGPDYLLVLKLHPRERLEDYTPAADGELPIRLIKDGEIAELIAPAEAFISSSSSTVLLAMMLDKPIVTVNFNRVPHFDYYEQVGGTLHAKTPAAAAESLRRALSDELTRERLATERAAVLARYSRFDGQATQRLADLVIDLANRAS